RAARMLVVVLVLQAVVGYTQYFTHLPAALVEVHELGATALCIGAVQYFLALTHHAAEEAAVRLRAVPDFAGGGARAAAVLGPAPDAAEGTTAVRS
ncbi:MAG: hypothetical protein ACRDXC_11615, partial [Acidimicrobiales bacterium]